MDYIRRLEPTPAALRNGRIQLAILAGVMGILVALMALDPAARDTSTVTIAIASGVTLLGHVIAYAGRPTLARYRIGLVVMTVGIVTAFWMLLANPFVPVAR
jgi:hypothetical protein